jgi:hypothetical protein
MGEKYRVVVAEERTAFWGGQTLVKVWHIDGYTVDGFPFTVELPMTEASQEAIDDAVQEKISFIRGLIGLGK